MPIELKMPALSPTMEEGTLARWLVKEGDSVSSGDLLAEIETDKATMEFEAVDEGTITQILVPEGTDGVKVGAVIAMIAGEDEDASAPQLKKEPFVSSPSTARRAGAQDKLQPSADVETPSTEAQTDGPLDDARGERKMEGSIEPEEKGYGVSPATDPVPATLKLEPQLAPAKTTDRIKASPLAKRIAADQGIDLAGVAGTGPNGRIVKADVEAATSKTVRAEPVGAAGVAEQQQRTESTAPADSRPSPLRQAQGSGLAVGDSDIPHEVVKLSNMRKTIARRLTESKQQVPHIYLTVDIRLDALLKLRGELNASLESRSIKLSVNDMLIKALALALTQVPKCNVSFAGDQMLMYSRADISVAVSVPTGLITPIVTDAANKSLSKISTEIGELAARAKEGKLQPHEYQGGTASISNMGMMGIKQFEAVINPPQAMIMAIGAGEKRPYVVDDALAIATVMSATGSFDHRAIDGADGAELMKVFKELVEKPLGLVA
jgi:pyruvate dehydrogenase E2 component (dihydrolipoamide acetyltransferase)